MEYMESMIQRRYEAFEDALNEHFEDLDSIVLNCMAAGVPVDMFIIKLPELNCNFDFSTCVTSYIGFKPE